MKLLFLDTETTGLDPKLHAVIQIAGIVEIDGEVKEEFNFKCSPQKGDLISKQALEIQNLTIDQIRNLEPPAATYRAFRQILSKYVDPFNKEDKFFMVGQNTKFDYDFMVSFFEKNDDHYFYSFVRYHLIDVISLTAAAHVAGLMNLTNMKLETVAKHFGIELSAHDALNDIKATREIFYKYVDLLKRRV